MTVCECSQTTGENCSFSSRICFESGPLADISSSSMGSHTRSIRYRVIASSSASFAKT